MKRWRSKSRGYYAWKKRPMSQHQLQDTQLAEQINLEAAKGEAVEEKAPPRKSASKSRRVA